MSEIGEHRGDYSCQFVDDALLDAQRAAADYAVKAAELEQQLAAMTAERDAMFERANRAERLTAALCDTQAQRAETAEQRVVAAQSRADEAELRVQRLTNNIRAIGALYDECSLERLHFKLSAEIAHDEYVEAETRMFSMQTRAEAAEQRVGNLLARIFRDGGQRQAEFENTDAACAAADIVVAELFVAEQRVAGLRAVTEQAISALRMGGYTRMADDVRAALIAEATAPPAAEPLRQWGHLLDCPHLPNPREFCTCPPARGTRDELVKDALAATAPPAAEPRRGPSFATYHVLVRNEPSSVGMCGGWDETTSAPCNYAETIKHITQWRGSGPEYAFYRCEQHRLFKEQR